jgi:hypothetical protein
VNSNNPLPTTVRDLAIFLNYPLSKLLRFARRPERYYFRKEIPKKDGRSIRVIHPPVKDLKLLQKLIRHRIIQRLAIHNAIHSYRKGRSTLTNASFHVNKQLILALDIEDFFPSITPEQVRQIFLLIGCIEPVADILTKLTTLPNQLPQGAPSSPDLANRVLFPLLKRIDGLCK